MYSSLRPSASIESLNACEVYFGPLSHLNVSSSGARSLWDASASLTDIIRVLLDGRPLERVAEPLPVEDVDDIEEVGPPVRVASSWSPPTFVANCMS